MGNSRTRHCKTPYCKRTKHDAQATITEWCNALTQFTITLLEAPLAACYRLKKSTHCPQPRRQGAINMCQRRTIFGYPPTLKDIGELFHVVGATMQSTAEVRIHDNLLEPRDASGAGETL